MRVLDCAGSGLERVDFLASDVLGRACYCPAALDPVVAINRVLYPGILRLLCFLFICNQHAWGEPLMYRSTTPSVNRHTLLAPVIWMTAVDIASLVLLSLKRSFCYIFFSFWSTRAIHSQLPWLFLYIHFPFRLAAVRWRSTARSVGTISEKWTGVSGGADDDTATPDLETSSRMLSSWLMMMIKILGLVFTLDGPLFTLGLLRNPFSSSYRKGSKAC
jgi:hypothetical protein